jgi:hypothetical protein
MPTPVDDPTALKIIAHLYLVVSSHLFKSAKTKEEQ